jgi:nicotinate-nucleotide adenylyltransferase
MKIAIYGGSFNPPHLGHVRAARAAINTLAPDRFFFLPVSVPPHKTLEQGSPNPAERLKLTKLAASEIPGTEVLDIELKRGGASYTVDTLRQLANLFPGAELEFLMGTDMFLSIDGWREPEAVMALARVGVFARMGGEMPELISKAEVVRRTYGAHIDVIPSDPLNISSSEIRTMLPARQGCGYLPDSVYEHIIRLRLYGAKPDLVWLRKKAYTYLDPRRVPHVQGTEREAVRLARRWGEDESDAAEAAILHDVTKRLTRTEQLQLCKKYGIMTDNCELSNEKLLHAKTGAALSADVFGVPANIASAIRWHTTGRPGMTRLEKILYLADYIEPTRQGFDGLDELRSLAYRDLDACMELGLALSLQEVRSKGQIPHENTTRAEAWFAERLHG